MACAAQNGQFVAAACGRCGSMIPDTTTTGAAVVNRADAVIGLIMHHGSPIQIPAVANAAGCCTVSKQCVVITSFAVHIPPSAGSVLATTTAPTTSLIGGKSARGKVLKGLVHVPPRRTVRAVRAAPCVCHVLVAAVSLIVTPPMRLVDTVADIFFGHRLGVRRCSGSCCARARARAR